jgi:hypothetical protein
MSSSCCQAAADGMIGNRPRRIRLVVQPSLKLAQRIAVVGPDFGTRGTDRQSVDAAGNVVNFRRRQLACVLATQDSVAFVHVFPSFHE